MCEIDISLNCEEIEHIIKNNNNSAQRNSIISSRGELFSGNIATSYPSKR